MCFKWIILVNIDGILTVIINILSFDFFASTFLCFDLALTFLATYFIFSWMNLKMHSIRLILNDAHYPSESLICLLMTSLYSLALKISEYWWESSATKVQDWWPKQLGSIYFQTYLVKYLKRRSCFSVFTEVGELLFRFTPLGKNTKTNQIWNWFLHLLLALEV